MILTVESIESKPASSTRVAIVYWLVLSLVVAAVLGYRWRQHSERQAREERKTQRQLKAASDWGALTHAIKTGNVSKIEWLLGGIVDEELESRALHGAALEGQTAVVKLFIDRGVPPSIDALRCAVDSNYPDIAELLLKRGAPVEPKTKGERTPLVGAASGGSNEIVRLLLKRGADVNSVVASDPRGMMLGAPIRPERAQATKRPNRTPRNFTPLGPMHTPTALFAATLWGHADTARILLKAGADPTVRNNKGKSALDVAVESGHHELAALLRQAEQRSDNLPPR